jgi:peptidoglycan/LPS O-acetylase OafA/YrhL
MVAILIAISAVYQMIVFVVWHVDIFKTVSAPVLVLNPLSKFLLFGCGMLLAHMRSTNNALVRSRATIGISLSVFVIAAGTGVVLMHPFPAASDILIGVGCAALLAAVVWSPPAAGIVRALSIAPVVFLGELSYGIYIWHLSVIQLLGHMGLMPANFTLALMLVGVVTVAFSAVTYWLVERPALSLKRFWASSQMA